VYHSSQVPSGRRRRPPTPANHVRSRSFSTTRQCCCTSRRRRAWLNTTVQMWTSPEEPVRLCCRR